MQSLIDKFLDLAIAFSMQGNHKLAQRNISEALRLIERKHALETEETKCQTPSNKS